VDRSRSSDLRDRQHVLDAREHFDASHGRPQAQQIVQVCHHASEIELFVRRLLLHGVVSD
jgi:hypothetical protein